MNHDSDYFLFPTESCQNFAELNSHFDDRNLVILNYNVRSLRKRIDELQILLKHLSFKPAVLVLTETQLQTECAFRIDHYNGYNSLAQHSTHDSISVFVRQDITDYAIRKIDIKHCHALEINLTFDRKICLIACYRSPSLSADLFLEELRLFFQTKKTN